MIIIGEVSKEGHGANCELYCPMFETKHTINRNQRFPDWHYQIENHLSMLGYTILDIDSKGYTFYATVKEKIKPEQWQMINILVPNIFMTYVINGDYSGLDFYYPGEREAFDAWLDNLKLHPGHFATCDCQDHYNCYCDYDYIYQPPNVEDHSMLVYNFKVDW